MKRQWIKMFKKWRKRKFEKFIGINDSDDMTCEKCGQKCGPSVSKSFLPIGNGKVRCSDCWDWL